MKPILQWTHKDILEFLKSVDKKTWLIGSSSVIAGVLFITFIVWPAWFKRVEVAREIKLLEGRIVTVETLKQRKPQLLQDKEEFQNLIDDVKERLFGPGETAFLLGAVSRLAEESGISIVASRPKEYEGEFPPPFDMQYEGSLYEFSVEGGYHEMGDFVSRIEANAKVLRIQSFKIKPFGDEADEGIMASMTLSAVSLQDVAS